MELRLYQPSDLPRLAEIECFCNLSDPLARYTAVDIQNNWNLHLDASVHFLTKKLLESGTICWVAAANSASERASPGDIIAWSIWTRKGTSLEARDWQHKSKSDIMIRELRSLEQSYTIREHAPMNDVHIDLIKHIIYKPTVPDEMGILEFWELDGMYVDPAHQRRGAGQILLDWGLRQADTEGVPIVTKSSPVGVYLYEKNGFVSFERQQLESFFEVGHKGMHCMIREPRD